MRLLPITLLLATALMTAAAASSHTAQAAPPAAPSAQQQQPDAGDSEDTRVSVQLVVVGAAIVTVVGIGGAAYLVRRRLGLTKYDPNDHASGH